MKQTAADDARHHFITICRRAVSRGMQVSAGGNLSMRIDVSVFLVKPSGKALCDLEAGDLLVCNDQGEVMEGQGKPTKELKSHLAIYRVQPRTGAIVHYHPPYATAYAVAGRPLPLPTVHARRTLQHVPLISPPGEGSPELATALEKAFANEELRAALLAEHGIIAAGSDLTEAQNLAELVEESARIAYLASHIAGFERS